MNYVTLNNGVKMPSQTAAFPAKNSSLQQKSGSPMPDMKKQKHPLTNP